MRDPLDPALADLVAEFEKREVSPWHALSVDEARHLEDDLFTPAPDAREDVGAVTEFEVDGDAGSIALRIYTPDAPGPHPLLVFCHGGGWIMGTLDSADDICRGFCRRAERVVVSVDYRLAPEHPFPVGLADAITALHWVGANATSIDGDPDDIAVAGTSAGGNLAAGLARYSTTETAPAVSRQLLLYPMLDRDTTRDSYRENADAPFLVPADIEWFWDQYLRHEVDAANPYAVPLNGPHLESLPPATIVSAGHDPLYSEAFAYVAELQDAGVNVVHHHYPGLCHGFLSMAGDVPTASAAFDELAVTIE